MDWTNARSLHVMNAAVYLFEQMGGSVRPYDDFMICHLQQFLQSPTLGNDLLFMDTSNSVTISQSSDIFGEDYIPVLAEIFKNKNLGLATAYSHFLHKLSRQGDFERL